MTASRSILAGLLLCTVSPAALAQEEPPPEELAGDFRAGFTGARNAMFPVAQILEALERSRGLAFIFDSQLLTGRFMRALKDPGSQRDLESALSEADLTLHKVGDRTFAITTTRAEHDAPAPIGIAPPVESAPAIDMILVTGVYSAIGTPAGSRNIITIDADDIIFRSNANVAETVFDLPQAIASISPANTVLYPGASGLSLADLRGLAAHRTLVLVDGKTRTVMPSGNDDIRGVDLNLIAAPFLERIEISGVAGGARFGPSAVAGAVNFVTRAEFEGLEAGAHYEISERGDAKTVSAHIIGGGSIGDDIRIMAGVNYVRNDGLSMGERPELTTPYGFVPAGLPDADQFLPGYGGSATTPRGAFVGVIMDDGSYISTPRLIPNDSGGIDPYQGRLDQRYDWTVWQSLITPDERGIATFNASYSPSDSITLRLGVDAAMTSTGGALAPAPLLRGRGLDPLSGDLPVIDISNPTLPGSIVNYVRTAFGPGVSKIAFERRFIETGPRTIDIDRTQINVVAGMDYESRGGTLFSVDYRFARNGLTSTDHDRIDLIKLNRSLDPTACATDPECIPVDFFSSAGISSASLEYITVDEAVRKTALAEHQLSGTLSRSLHFTEAHTLLLSAGAEFRQSILSSSHAYSDGVEPASHLPGSDAGGALSTVDLFAGAEAELFQDGNFPGEITAALALRLTQSSAFRDVANIEAALDWRPVDGVRLHARSRIGARPPDVFELYDRSGALFYSYSDPCGSPPATQSSIVAENCASAGPFGVGPGFVAPNALAKSARTGNPDLGPEKVRSIAAGITLTPTDILPIIPGQLEITATWIDIKITDVIEDYESVLAACYGSVGLSSPACYKNVDTREPAIMRDPVTRQITAFDSVLHNLGDDVWRGLDLEMRYAIELDGAGLPDRIWASALHTYTDRVERVSVSENDNLAGLASYPRHRTLGSIGAEFGNVSVTGYVNRRGRALTARSTLPEARLSPVLYLDLATRLEFTEDAFVQFSVQNLTNRQPEITAFNFVGNFAPEFYDPIGRRYGVSVRMRF